MPGIFNVLLLSNFRALVAKIHFFQFFHIPIFSKILSLYFWRTEHALRLCKIPKHYARNCLEYFPLVLVSFIMIQISDQNAILNLVRIIVEIAIINQSKFILSVFDLNPTCRMTLSKFIIFLQSNYFVFLFKALETL